MPRSGCSGPVSILVSPRMGFHTFAWQTVPVFDHPHCDFFLSIVGISLFAACAFASFPVIAPPRKVCLKTTKCLGFFLPPLKHPAVSTCESMILKNVYV